MRLKELRQNLHCTQEKIANDLNIARTTYRNYENGDREPSLEFLIKIADYFDISLDYLLGRQNNNLLFIDSLSPAKKELISMIKGLNEDETFVAIGMIAKLANQSIDEVMNKIKKQNKTSQNMLQLKNKE